MLPDMAAEVTEPRDTTPKRVDTRRPFSRADAIRAGVDPKCAESALPALRRRAAAAYVRRDVDSPMESRLRILLVLAGFPEPRVNRKLRAADGEILRRYDLSYETSKVIVEYDGRQHIEREKQWESDLERREQVDDDGWRIIVVVAKGIYTRPEETLRQVRRVLLARGEAGVPDVLSDAWRPHFPGRE